MIISYKWLLDYLPEPLPVEQLSEILTSIGLEVEAVEKVESIPGSLEGLVIGEVLTCERHPNADKLSVTTVNIGAHQALKIVCGAPNVAAGQHVVVAPVGSRVHPISGEAFDIKKAKIRGMESEGMICAEDEIGLGESHDGILILPDTAPPGMAAASWFSLPLPDYALHIGLTPNRSDAMSHIGVARDVCAYLSHHREGHFQVQMPELLLPDVQEELAIMVTVEAPEACARYTGLSLTGVEVKPSPDWLQQRLKTIGIRPINNVVDITNFVLHEYGQPLHAFDADQIAGNKVRVGFLPQDSLFQTLDGVERKLNANDLMICDEQKGMCMAGVFGGAGSGITTETTNVFLESAFFDATYIRRTSVHHGLRTDAATHFEKGVDINNLIPALKRAAGLICAIAGGALASAITDVYPQVLPQKIVDVSFDFINRLSGKPYNPVAAERILTALGFEILRKDANGLQLAVPGNKTDVAQPADIVEEILRIDGLDHIPFPERLNISLMPTRINDRQMREKLAEMLVGEGFQEIVTNSIVNSRYYPDRGDLVHMLNSLSSELDVMRPSMLESGLEVIQYNGNRRNNDLMLFEFGNVYHQQEGRYDETAQLALWITGKVHEPHWDQKERSADLYYLKGILDNLLRRSGIRGERCEVSEGCLVYRYKRKTICTVERVGEQRLSAFDLKQDVYFAAIQWSNWVDAAAGEKIRFSEVAKYPAVQRDLALVLDQSVSYQQVAEATSQLKLGALRSFDLFDVFESEKLGLGKKSLALSYTFQLSDRTLTDEEIDGLMQSLVNTYQKNLQAQIRG